MLLRDIQKVDINNKNIDPLEVTGDSLKVKSSAEIHKFTPAKKIRKGMKDISKALYLNQR